MAPTISSDTTLPKIAEQQPSAEAARGVESAPGKAASVEPTSSPQAGAQSTYTQPRASEALPNRAGGDPVGVAKILPLEPQTDPLTSFRMQGDGRALQSIVDAIGASDGRPTSSTGSQNAPMSTAPSTDGFRFDTPSADRATKRIVANISEATSKGAGETASAPHAREPQAAGQMAEDARRSESPQVRQASLDSGSGLGDTARTGVKEALDGRGLLSTPYAEGMELLSAQTMLARTDGMLAELQALVDAYAELHLHSDLQTPLLGKQLDNKTLALLLSQAAGTDLGKMSPNSAVFVLGTVPQTIIEDNQSAQRYSIFNMAGELLEQFDHAEAHLFGIDLSEGRQGALGTGGYLTSFHLLGSHNRTIISALRSSTTPSNADSKRTKIDRKVARVATLGTPFNDAGDCASTCFVNQGSGDGGAATREPGRCVLCRHQQQ